MAKKKTHEEFIKEVYDLVGEEYTVLGAYQGNKNKLKMKHNKCHDEYKVAPVNFLSGKRCPKCSGNKRKSHDDFVKEVYDLVKDDYIVLGIYKNNHTKIFMQHKECEYKYNVMPSEFLKGIRCLMCNGGAKSKDTEFFKQEVFNLVGDNYEVLTEYTYAYEKIKMKHNLCGYEYDVTPSNFLGGRRCPDCSGKMKRTQEQFTEEIKQIHNGEIEILGIYKNRDEKILVKHKIENCNKIFETRPTNLLNGHSCPYCAGNAKKTNEQFVEEVYNLVNDQYLFLKPYVNNSTKLTVKHNTKECGYIYEVTPTSFISGQRCPKCAGKIVTNEFFVNKLKELYDEEYIPLESYQKCDIKLEILHNIKGCGDTFYARPSSLLKGHGCPKCALRNRSGENAYNWKNGITPLHNYLRRKIIRWKNDSKAHCNYRCAITGEKFGNIHHLYGFDLILQETVSELNIDIRDNIGLYSEEEIKLLEDKCLEIHYRYPLGVCLREDVHNLFHDLYGRGGNTPEQFEEFKLRWRMGEFENIA